MTIQEIKEMRRTEEGIFDLGSLGERNIYAAAEKIYPVYAEYETKENKKEGYPDIMAQLRTLFGRVKEDFTFTDAADFAAMLLGTIKKMSPEIYENYRELVDMFREMVKLVLDRYYEETSGRFAGDDRAADRFCEAVKEACDIHLLLAEKYSMCF